MTSDLDPLKRIVMAWDADQDDEFDEALDAARERCGLKLVDNYDQVTRELETQAVEAIELDEQQSRRQS